MLRTERICKVWSLNDLFDDGQWCPICLGREFTLVEGDSITCDGCGASFWLRYTGGDRGVIIDCQPDESYGRFVVPAERVVVGEGAPQFWQVLKTCNYGLGDRDHWCCNVKKGSLYWLEADGPAGKELLHFGPVTAGIEMLERWWTSKTEGSPEGLERRAKYEAQFRKDNLLEGFYFQEQCEAVWGKKDQNRRCVPVRNQKPYQRGQDHCQRCGLPASISRQA